MDKKKLFDKPKMKSSIILTAPAHYNSKNKSSFELNMNEEHIFTTQDLDNKQKLFDFISDKNKFCLKSHFDHNGTKEFLNGKDEAMKKIVLNENIEENGIKSSKKDSKNKKKILKMKSEGFILKNLKINKVSLNTEISKKNKKKKRISKSNKFLSNCGKNQLINLKHILDDFDLEEPSKWETLSPINKPNRKRKSVKEKVKKDKKERKERAKKKEKKDNDKSIISIVTVDSKLFNNKIDYDNYKRFVTKTDVPIFENILYELDVNKKS